MLLRKSETPPRGGHKHQLKEGIIFVNRDDLFDDYKFLVDAVINASRLKKGRAITAGMYVKGSRYSLDKEPRLLIIGRALNGWDAKDIVWETGAVGISASKKAKQILNHWHNQETSPAWGENTKRFHDRALTKPVSESECIALEWIHSYYHDDKSNNLTRTSESPFWRYAGAVSQMVLGIQDYSWSKHVAWTNLYKIAPANEGNPTDALCDRQLLACQQILRTELSLLKPTHILVIAKTRHRGNKIETPDKDAWTKDFYHIFEEYQKKHPVCISYVARPEFASEEAFNAMIKQTKKDFHLEDCF